MLKKLKLSCFVMSCFFLAGATVSRADGPAPNLIPDSTAPKYKAQIPYMQSLGPDGVVDVQIVKSDSDETVTLPVGAHFFIRNMPSGTVFTLPEGYEVRFQALVPNGALFTALRELSPPDNQPVAKQESELRSPASGKPSAVGNPAGKVSQESAKPDQQPAPQAQAATPSGRAPAI